MIIQLLGPGNRVKMVQTNTMCGDNTVFVNKAKILMYKAIFNWVIITEVMPGSDRSFIASTEK